LLITHILTHNLREGWSIRFAGDGDPAAGGTVRCGVPPKVVVMVCIPFRRGVSSKVFGFSGWYYSAAIANDIKLQ